MLRSALSRLKIVGRTNINELLSQNGGAPEEVGQPLASEAPFKRTSDHKLLSASQTEQ